MSNSDLDALRDYTYSKSSSSTYDDRYASSARDYASDAYSKTSSSYSSYSSSTRRGGMSEGHGYSEYRYDRDSGYSSRY
jgi:hypothetical protein